MRDRVALRPRVSASGATVSRGKWVRGLRRLAGEGRPARAWPRHGARWLEGGGPGPGVVGACLGFAETGLGAGPEPTLTCKVTGAIGVGPRSSQEEALVVTEPTAKPQMSSALQVRRQIVNFGVGVGITWRPWQKYEFAALGLKLWWAGTHSVEFNKFPHVIPML